MTEVDAVETARGRMASDEARIFSDTVRRLTRGRGGTFEMLSLLPGQQAGDVARSIEGWVLIVTGLPQETTEGDLLDFFGQVAGLHSARMNSDRRDQSCIGHALVEYVTREGAEAAVGGLSGKPFLSAPSITVAPAFLCPPLDAFTDNSNRKRTTRDEE